MTRETVVEPGNASVAVIGAGDYINRAIARKFASEGFVVFVGRRRGDKLAPLVAEVEAAGGRISGRSLDARKEEDLNRLLRGADKTAPYPDGSKPPTGNMVDEMGGRCACPIHGRVPSARIK
jgi:NAD(P)-dependent dehydrogenase (short-subunit alcohol dehydrogenase family)